MAWSLLNHNAAAQVDALLDGVLEHWKDDTSFKPAMPRDVAASVIHAAIWAASSRSDSTAGVMAYSNLFDALSLETWTLKAPTPADGPAEGHDGLALG